MPTGFGLTSLPLIEAWWLGKPLIYSKHLVAEVGDAAIMTDQNDIVSIENAMHRCLEGVGIYELVEAGKGA